MDASVLTLESEKLVRDWQWVLGLLREVLEHSGESQLAEMLPVPGVQLDAERGPDSVRLTQAYSIAFQLLSMAEQNAAAQFRNAVESQAGMNGLPALWGDSLRQLASRGWSSREIAEALAEIQVELVLTAHPTEAKRATVLAHHRRLYQRFVYRERSDVADWSQHDNDQAIRALLSILWRTGEIYLDKPDLQSERRNVVDYLTHVFPAALRPLDVRFREAWREAGFDPAEVAGPLALPRLTFGTWVGGDRDGHPLVTADVTAQTLRELRDNALDLTRRQLLQLARLLSLSAYWIKPAPEFLQLIASRAEALGEAGRWALQRNPNEPWRQFVNLMLARTPLSHQRLTHAGGASEPAPNPYLNGGELLADLRLLYDSLVEVDEGRVADHAVQPVMRIVQSFGFHLAVLDIRQNSSWHDRAVEQLLEAAGFEDIEFGQWSEQRRLEFLNRELTSRRPFVPPDAVLGTEAEGVLSSYRVIKQHLRANGAEGLGALIVSMTRSVSDLLTVYLLAREVGLLEPGEESPYCPLPVVPLFETISDLQGASDIYDQFLTHPITRSSLVALQRRRGTKEPVGQVMIGYSDSNKDGGILASLVGLRQAQREISAAGAKHGVRVRFFHGRGGTISRGAGPTHRFIKALPDNTLAGDLRLTEQGETIAQKYAHEATAIYNLELFLAGSMRKSLEDRKHGHDEHPLEGVLVDLAQRAQQQYTTLLQTEGFLTFFRQATPIDAIEQSRIGSRPSRRTGQQALTDLRAIPWVFAWGQARFYLSGWYGVGSALLDLQARDPDAYRQVNEQTKTWAPLHYLASNIATSLAATDWEVMTAYAAMVEDAEIRDRFMSKIEEELKRTRSAVEAMYGGPLAEQRPNIHRMLELRREGLRMLHRQQITLLKRWRAYRMMEEMKEAEALTPPLLLTVNAIASGLGTTG
jgi:phosphoenolpyruvate carboxylase